MISETDLNSFATFEEAYHQLMIELMDLQIHTIKNAIGSSEIKTIYIDGGFTDNDVFMKLMSHHFPGLSCDVYTFSIRFCIGSVDGDFNIENR
jgi:hypothetical protein